MGNCVITKAESKCWSHVDYGALKVYTLASAYEYKIGCYLCTRTPNTEDVMGLSYMSIEDQGKKCEKYRTFINKNTAHIIVLVVVNKVVGFVI